MSTLGLFAFLVLVTLRLVRLWMRDDILIEPREWVLVKLARWPKWAAFTLCPWCLGFWIGAGLVACVWPFVDMPLPILWPFAINVIVAPAYGLVD